MVHCVYTDQYTLIGLNYSLYVIQQTRRTDPRPGPIHEQTHSEFRYVLRKIVSMSHVVTNSKKK